MTTVSRAKPYVGQYFLVFDRDDAARFKRGVIKNAVHWALWRRITDNDECSTHISWSGTHNKSGRMFVYDKGSPFDTYPMTDVQATGLIMRAVHGLSRERWHEICHEMTGVEP